MTPDQLFGTYFTEDTMSVHIRSHAYIQRKRGKPGAWVLESLEDLGIPGDELVLRIFATIQEDLLKEEKCFQEYSSKYAYVFQLQRYRVVVTLPPLSSFPEMTLVRPIVDFSLEDYHLPEVLLKRLEKAAEGILIAGTPGNGKTTFAQALLRSYAEAQKIVKTIEVPRDLRVPEGVTQYALSHSTLDELRNLLLLTRPDYTFFDEIRNPEDFALYKDLRLTGIGMVGVIHAARPMDAVQRFLSRVDLGVLPEVVDTIAFIDKGIITHVYGLQITVKVPHGLADPDLARPVLLVSDVLKDTIAYEVYTFGDETVVMPLEGENALTSPTGGLEALGLQELRRKLQRELSYEFQMTSRGTHGISLILDDRDMAGFIGKGGSHIRDLEQQWGVKIDVKSKGEAQQGRLKEEVRFQVRAGKKGALFIVPEVSLSKGVLVCDGRAHVEVWADRDGVISLDKKSPARRALQHGTARLYRVE